MDTCLVARHPRQCHDTHIGALSPLHPVGASSFLYREPAPQQHRDSSHACPIVAAPDSSASRKILQPSVATRASRKRVSVPLRGHRRTVRSTDQRRVLYVLVGSQMSVGVSAGA
jgi:hypothetical protein